MTRFDIVVFVPGGDDRIRTGDPLLAKQVLSQLSYIPGQIRRFPDENAALQSVAEFPCLS